MNKILPIIIILIAVAGSGFAAMQLRGGGPKSDAAHGEGDVKEAHHEEPKPALAYFKFQRDFIVPVMQGKTVESLIFLSLTLEMDESRVEYARPKEPKLRDSFMQTLMGLSHEGAFDGDITSPELYQEIQSRLIDAAREVIGDEEVSAVLITDFARQHQ